MRLEARLQESVKFISAWLRKYRSLKLMLIFSKCFYLKLGFKVLRFVLEWEVFVSKTMLVHVLYVPLGSEIKLK